jgi:hypothetical protein
LKKKIDVAKVSLENFISNHSEFFLKIQNFFFQFSKVPATPWDFIIFYRYQCHCSKNILSFYNSHAAKHSESADKKIRNQFYSKVFQKNDSKFLVIFRFLETRYCLSFNRQLVARGSEPSKDFFASDLFATFGVGEER